MNVDSKVEIKQLKYFVQKNAPANWQGQVLTGRFRAKKAQGHREDDLTKHMLGGRKVLQSSLHNNVYSENAQDGEASLMHFTYAVNAWLIYI